MTYTERSHILIFDALALAIPSCYIYISTFCFDHLNCKFKSPINQQAKACHIFSWLKGLDEDNFHAILENRINKAVMMAYLFLMTGVCPGERPPAYLVLIMPFVEMSL
jgi:hypothetical protein